MRWKMAVDYDLVCRSDDLGPLLAAAFLAKEECRVLLLPPLPETTLEPNFLIPVVRGYPARLLSSLVELEKPLANFLSWQDGAKSRFWPYSENQEIEFPELAESDLAPELWLELEQLWQLLDRCMTQGLEMPASSLGGICRMIWLLVRNEFLRERRHCNLKSWFETAEIPVSEQRLWRSLVPLFSLSRFADPPLLSFAYGVQTLLKPDARVGFDVLKDHLLKYLLSHGAHQAAEEWAPVFDGKWFIGVGSDDKVARRATLFLADSNPESLMQEVPLPRRRRDFNRQFKLDEPGFCHLQTPSTKFKQETGQALYHLDCRGVDDFTGSTLFGPEGENQKNLVEHRWHHVDASPVDALGDDLHAAINKNIWGWKPQLPAMMGGGFLPLSGSFCRFYQVGWHNLPGFGLGGLIYSAYQVATSALKTDLKR